VAYPIDRHERPFGADSAALGRWCLSIGAGHARDCRVGTAHGAGERHNHRVTSDGKPIVAAYWQAYNAADWDALREVVADDYVHHSGDAESHDVEFFVSGAMGLRGAFPDVRVEVRDMVAEDDRVAVRWVARATHTGSLFGEEATGRPVTVDGMTVHRVLDDRIAEAWEVMNEGALRDQLKQEPATLR
jgi:steroid delta-isomerase-like uncharacterized protein